MGNAENITILVDEDDDYEASILNFEPYSLGSKSIISGMEM